MQCTACGQDNPTGAQFCNGCGTALSAGCAACGGSNPAGALAVRRQARSDECIASLALARVLVQAEGARARAEIEAAIARGLALVEETGAALYKPRFHVERAELARLSGDEAAWERELREGFDNTLVYTGMTHRLFTEMGAPLRGAEIEKELHE